jgi:hypothetical protein
MFMFKLTAALGLAGILVLAGRFETPTARAMSCFAIAGTLSCIETPTVPFVPPVIVTGGAKVEGEDEHIVIRDNGGRHIARG